MSENFTSKNAENFSCDICEFICCKKSDWNRHITTRKHLNRTQLNILEQKKRAKNTARIYSCKQCNKNYKARNSLWYHEQKCTGTIKETATENATETATETAIMNESDMKYLILELVKSNGDLQKQMLEVCKNGNNTVISNSNNNSYNKTFNLQFFLNEQCKDAMNIMDFVNSMTLEFADLEAVGKLGYVEGISGIIIKKLNELDVYKRPIHCSDAKREIMFVKDDNVWEKENSTYDKLRKAIKYVTKKNGDMLIPWSKMYPACMNTAHPLNDTYIQLMGQAMGGKEEFVDSENKIMKKIAKSVLIDKTC